MIIDLAIEYIAAVESLAVEILNVSSKWAKQWEKVLAFVDGVHSKNRVGIPPQWKKNSFIKVVNMPTIIGELSINYEMTTPKSCHDVTTPMET